ncbi:MAG: putative Ig domain-containing protein [Verrucomicrobiia bacterium]
MDGPHTFEVRAIDLAGNADPSPSFYTWTVDTSPPPLTIDLDPSTDSAPLGDLETSFALVNLMGSSEPNTLVVLAPSGQKTLTDSNGGFLFADVPLALGQNEFVASAGDPAGNTVTRTLVVKRAGDSPSCLEASEWEILAGSTPSDRKQGEAVFADCNFTLSEGDSFLVTAKRRLTIPPGLTVVAVSFRSPSFDRSTQNHIKDAFEVAIVDDAGRSLVYTLDRVNAGFPATPTPDACFNETEGQTRLVAPGAALADSPLDPTISTLYVDASGLVSANLLLRLVNNDQDRNSSVTITSLQLLSALPAGMSFTPLPNIGALTSAEAVISNKTRLLPVFQIASEASTAPSSTFPAASAADSAESTAAPIFPVAANIEIHPDYTATVFASVPNVAGLASAPEGSRYGPYLYASTDQYPDPGSGCGVGKIYRIASDGTATFLGDLPATPPGRVNPLTVWGATTYIGELPPEASPWFIAFPPPGSSFGDNLFISNFILDGEPCNGWHGGGTIVTMEPSGVWRNFTGIGRLGGGPANPMGMAFTHGSEFGDRFFIANSNGRGIQSPIAEIGLSGEVLRFFNASYIGWGQLLLGKGPWEDRLIYGNGGEIRLLSNDFSSAQIWSGSVFGLAVSANEHFGNFIYHTVITNGTDTQMAIKRLSPTGQDETFATIKNTSYHFNAQFDSLEFSADGKVLYLADWPNNRVYRITPNFEPTALFLSLNATPAHVRAGTELAISGLAGYTGRLSGRGKALNVSINSQAVEALDVSGNFYTRAIIKPGRNSFNIQAADELGGSASAVVEVVGTEADRHSDLSRLSVVSGSIIGEYGRTTFNESTGMLYTDLALKNKGTYSIDAPLYVGIARLSDPSVSVIGIDGVSNEGLPFFDFSGAVTSGRLNPNQVSEGRTIAFLNPKRVQFTYTLVILGQVNEAPYFTTSPRLEATVARPYSYRFGADDPNGDQLTYSLVSGPHGMTLDPSFHSLGLTPGLEQVGTHNVLLQVSDSRGGLAEQHFVFSIALPLPNRPPSFVSTPALHARVSSVYTYQASATDPDSDVLEFALSSGAPASMTIDSETGLVRWTPGLDDIGEHPVNVSVLDGRGAGDTQSFVVTVLPETTPDPLANVPPVITSTAPELATVGLPYEYVVRAQDAENQPLTFALGPNSPLGMVFSADRSSSSSAVLEWKPASADIGARSVQVIVTDSQGATAQQDFTLGVLASSANHPPVFLTKPRAQTGLGFPWVYPFQAFDQDGDRLTYELLSAPAEMLLTTSPSGSGSVPYLTWTPKLVGSFTGLLVANDGRGGGSVTQSFEVLVTSALSNSAPVIVSSPSLTAAAGQPYRYDLVATDPDNDFLSWGLVTSPRGVSLDAGTGALRWTPDLSQIGPASITVRVQDLYQSATTQTFHIVVSYGNHPPQITSTPSVTANVNSTYLYGARASDLDGDTLSWSLGAPRLDGMVIDSSTGLIRWTPAPGQAGPQSVRLEVSDNRGGVDIQSFIVEVATTPANSAPAVASTAPRFAVVGRPYAYAFRATDRDGDLLSVQWLVFPTGASLVTTASTAGQIDAQVLWTPTSDQLGENAFGVIAQDPSLAKAVQQFSVTVRPNLPPLITSEPPRTAVPFVPFYYDTGAYDPDGDPVTYALVGPVPTGLTIDGLGRIAWTPSLDQIGTATFTVSVSDNFGAVASKAFSVAVQADNKAPVCSMALLQGLTDSEAGWVTDVESPVKILATAIDDVGVASLALRIGNELVALSGVGVGTFIPQSSGTYPVTLTAVDAAGNVGTATSSLRVIDPSAANSLVIQIESPAADATVTAQAPILASLQSPVPITGYTVHVARAGEVNLGDISQPDSAYMVITNVTLQPGTTSIQNAILATFDPTVLVNDSYLIRVSATDINGGTTYEGVLVHVQGTLKFGEFSLSFTDLSVPVAGIPITVTRTYDSRLSSRRGDFGYGWSLGIRDARILVASPDSAIHQGTRIYLTAPDGRRIGFTAKLAVTGGGFFFTTTRFVFEPDPGVYERLDADGLNDVYFGRTSLGALLSGPPTLETVQLTTKDGLVYLYDKSVGLREITDPNGNKLVFGPNGIQHTAPGATGVGQEVRFERDAQGRIGRVIDPTGNAIVYRYNAAGDLVSVEDQAANLTQFAYHVQQTHYLDKITDPLGREAIRTEYDNAGRVKAITDALGHVVSQEFDPAALVGTFTDANGHVTTSYYDERGNVIKTVDPEGGITEFQFDSNNNEIWRKDPRGYVTTRDYDTRGNLNKVTDPLNNVTLVTYNEQNKPLDVTDALGRTTQFE